MRKTAIGTARPLVLEFLEDRTLPSATANVIDLSGLQVNTSSYAPDNILVQFRSAPQSLRAGTTVGQQLGLVANLFQVNLAQNVTVDQALAAYRASPAVLAAEPDYQLSVQSVPNDPDFNQQWALNNTGQNGGIAGEDIGAEQAWSVTTGSPKVTVAVIDSGIDYDNADLYGNVWINQAEIPTLPFAPGSGLTGSRRSNLVDVDHDGLITFADLNNPINQGLGKITDVNGDGRIDAADILAPMVTVTINGKLYDTGKGGWAYAGNTQDGDTAHPNDFIGWNFVNNTNNPFDDDGHGTNVSGIIGAMGNNGVGVAGVDWQVSLMPVKFLAANGTGSLGAFIDGLNYSVQHEAKISNNSWSGAADSQILIDAINNARSAGQIFVAAAGNGATDTDTNPAYPSSFPINNIVSVAATTDSDQLASFSNYGVQTVALAAPGVSILSTMPGGTYQALSGTSMAAPVVTGVLALVWSEHPTWTYQQVIAQVENTVTPVAGLKGKVATGGVVDAARAVGAQSAPLPTPAVLGTVASGPVQNSLSSVLVYFSQPIDTKTFSASTVTLTGPTGKAIPITSIQALANTGGMEFNVNFATQTAGGTYTFAIGSAVHDTAGTALRAFQTTFNLLSVSTFTSTGPVPIPKLSKVSSLITVNQDIPISEVQVLVSLSYPGSDSDLYIHLTSPSGTDILLSNRRGGTGHNFTNTLFSDDATVPVASGSAPFTGTFAPEAALSNFDTEDARGVWRLWVEDRGSGSGVITSWSLMITGSAVGGAQSQSLAPQYDANFGVTLLTGIAQTGSADLGRLMATAAAGGVFATSVMDADPPTMTRAAAPVSPPQAPPTISDHVFSATESTGDIRALAWLSRLGGSGDDGDALPPDLES